MTQPMEDLCRICVRSDQRRKTLVCVFSTIDQRKAKGGAVHDEPGARDQDSILVQTVAEVMACCLDVEIKPNDQLPQKICHTCLSKLKESWLLRETCKASEKQLKQMLYGDLNKDVVKLEVSAEEALEEDEYLEDVDVSTFMDEEILEEEPVRTVNPDDPLHSEFGWLFSDLGKGHYKVKRGEDGSWDQVEVDDYRCCGCFQFFGSKDEMEEHCKQDHKEEPHGDRTKRYECGVCLKLFSSTDALNFHQKMARSRQLFHCKMCQVLSPSKRQLKAHLKLHASKSLETTLNPEASRPGLKSKETPPASSSKRTSGEPPSSEKCREVKNFTTFDYMTFDGFCCCDCWTYCDSKREMKRHGEKEHYGNRGFEEVNECFACLRSFEDKAIFDQHMAELNTRHIYYCKTCKLMFRTSDQLQEHQQTSAKHEGFIELEMIDIKEEVEVEEKIPLLKIQPMQLVVEPSRRKKVAIKARSESPVEDSGDDGADDDNGDEDDDLDYAPDESCKTQNFEEPYGRRLYAPKVKRNDPDLAEITVVEISNQDAVRCCGCYQTFITEEELVDHSNELHQPNQVPDEKERPYECERCYRRFVKAVSLQIHRQFVKTIHVYTCKLCDEKFSFQTPFLIHYNNHEKRSGKEDGRGAKQKVKVENPKFYCCFNLCKDSFTEYSDLLSHVDDNHGVKRNQFKDYRDTDDNCCEVCFRSFNNYRALIRHVTQQKKGPSARHTCTTCGVQTKSLAALKDHENKHLGIKPYECEICSKTFGTKTILKNHMIVHQKDRPFSCEICGKTFARKRNYKDHSMTHTDEKPWECEICKLTFRIESQFLTHKRRHTGVRPYKCKFCDKVFSHATDRKRHEMAAHTGEKPHQCSFCSFAFIRKRQLVIHERTHTGEKPFECQYCSQAFIQQSYLTRHLAIHKRQEFPVE